MIIKTQNLDKLVSVIYTSKSHLTLFEYGVHTIAKDTPTSIREWWDDVKGRHVYEFEGFWDSSSWGRKRRRDVFTEQELKDGKSTWANIMVEGEKVYRRPCVTLYFVSGSKDVHYFDNETQALKFADVFKNKLQNKLTVKTENNISSIV